MRIYPEELFSGEEILMEKNANSIVNINEYGLKKLTYNPMGKNEAVGGKLYLTNYRLVFKSHKLNRVNGTFSIFIPNIVRITDTSKFIMKKIEVVTSTQNIEFVIWKIPEFIAAVTNLKNQFTEENIIELRSIVRRDVQKCGAGLEKVKWHKLLDPNSINNVLEDIPISSDNSAELTNILGLGELFSKDR